MHVMVIMTYTASAILLFSHFLTMSDWSVEYFYRRGDAVTS